MLEGPPESLLAAAEVDIPCTDPVPVAAPLLVALTATAGSFPAASAEPSPAPFVAAARAHAPKPWKPIKQETSAEGSFATFVTHTRTRRATCKGEARSAPAALPTAPLSPLAAAVAAPPHVAGRYIRRRPMRCDCGGGCTHHPAPPQRACLQHCQSAFQQDTRGSCRSGDWLMWMLPLLRAAQHLSCRRAQRQRQRMRRLCR